MLSNFRVFVFIFFFVLIGLPATSSALFRSYDSRLTNFKYPYKVHEFKLRSQEQNLEMSYMDVKANNSKEVVVLLHGKNFSGFYWERIARDLVARGYRVIIPDQIGFGKSSKPKHYQYSFLQLALNTMKLLESLDIKSFRLVGHSMGGMLAVTVADTYPSSLKQLILINPIGLEEYQKYVQYKDPSFFYKNELIKTKAKVIAYQKTNYYDGKWSKSYESLVEPFAMQMQDRDWPLVAWNNALTYGPIFSESIVEKLKRLKVKAHLLIGTRDRTGPGRAWKKKGVNYELGRYDMMKKRIRLLNPKIRVTEFRGLGHMPQFEDYTRFSKGFFEDFPKISNNLTKRKSDMNLQRYQWKNRLLVVCDNSSEKSLLTKVRKVFSKDSNANKERELILVESCQNDSLGLENQEIALIGLDGGVKARYSELSSMKQIYTLIDSMPMRRNR